MPANEPFALRENAEPRRGFPWSRLLRGVRLAVDARKLLLAVLGLALVAGGWAVLDRIFPGSAVTPSVRPIGLLEYPNRVDGLAGMLGAAAVELTEPARTVVVPFFAVFSAWTDALAFVHALLAGVWAAVVWGIVGGAIARIAVVQFARGETMGLATSLRFALSKSVALIAGPLGPLLGVGVFGGFCVLYGLLYRIPGLAGPAIAGALLPLPIAAGLVMAIILAGLALGWPLIHASVATEAEDGFDALSRAYAYVQQRPGRYLACALIAGVAGSLGIIAVRLFALLVVALTHWGLSFTAPRTTLSPFFSSAGAVDPLSSTHAFWLFMLGVVVHAWVYSYFWTSAAIIYVLLRRDVDGTPIHEVVAPEPRIIAIVPGLEAKESPSTQVISSLE